ncbi:glycosylphosphatidylinositol transamidase [Cryptosporidium canis]|uniref:Glycosylphosphatidylinositol transamidase n=1 Tax=Cryptosporidium canis TaxID=195482 RepID=A0A9D5HYS5_9CRYT|nr:glycosylphosphatidylinositol transamidase [Cryptosporidium canis]
MIVFKGLILLLLCNLRICLLDILKKAPVNEFSFIELQSQNNWAVIVSTSRYWHNYRHNANALSFYNFLLRNGFRDDKVILMLAENIPCNPRNSIPGGVFSEDYDLFYNLNNNTQTMECADTDYKEEEVTVSNFIRVLTGKHSVNVPNKKRLLSDEKSNIFIFLTGHGGDGFLKFQDFEEMTSLELSNAIREMKAQKRFNKMFIISETCQASTLHNHLDFENVYAIGCSNLGQSSYSKHFKSEIGVATIDRFTHFSLMDFKKLDKNKLMPIISLIRKYSIYQLKSTPQIKYKLGGTDINQVFVNEFFFPNIEKVVPLSTVDIIRNQMDLSSSIISVSKYGKSKFLSCLLFKNEWKTYSANSDPLGSITNCYFKDTLIKSINYSQRRVIFKSKFPDGGRSDNSLTLHSSKIIVGLSVAFLLGFIVSYCSILL